MGNNSMLTVEFCAGMFCVHIRLLAKFEFPSQTTNKTLLKLLGKDLYKGCFVEYLT